MPSTPPPPSPAAPEPGQTPEELLRELRLSRQELRALLDITEAVNNDVMTEEALYRTFGFTLLAQLGFSPVALFVPETISADDVSDARGWVCRMSLPPRHNFLGTALPPPLVAMTKAAPLPTDDLPATWQAFRTVLPVRHHERLLAFVLVGGSLHGKTVVDYTDLGAFTFVQTLSSIVLVAAQNRQLARERLAREVLQREIEIAREVQGMLVPKHLPDTETIHVHATYIPHAGVGGDYYDFMELAPGRFLLCVADVSGKGVPASLLMANFQAGLRTVAKRAESLAEVVAELNHLIYSNAQADKFITAFIASYDASTRELRYVNAGHNAPLLARPDGSIELLKEGTLMLGVLDPLPFLNEGVAQVPPDTVLLGFTDGLTDVFDAAGVDYGEVGMGERLRGSRVLPLPALHQELLNDVANHAPVLADSVQPYADDITILTCRFR